MSARRLFRRTRATVARLEPHLVVGLTVIAAWVAGLLFSGFPNSSMGATILLIAVALAVVEDLI